MTFLFMLFVFSADMTASVLRSDSSQVGEHYRTLYSLPITVPPVTLQLLWGVVKMVEQAADFQGLLLENNQQQLCLLKPLGGYTTFIESKFFQEVYNKKVFENTYLDQFIGDAYTIINPYTFISADYLARSSGLSSNKCSVCWDWASLSITTLPRKVSGKRIR